MPSSATHPPGQVAADAAGAPGGAGHHGGEVQRLLDVRRVAEGQARVVVGGGGEGGLGVGPEQDF